MFTLQGWFWVISSLGCFGHELFLPSDILACVVPARFKGGLFQPILVGRFCLIPPIFYYMYYMRHNDTCKFSFRCLILTLIAPISTKVVCFFRLLKCLVSMANSVDSEQTAPIGAVCSGSTLFDSILNSSVMLGNYLQQTTFSDAFFSCRFKG